MNDMMNNPLSKYTIEECANMSPEEFDALLEADNEYIRQKYAKLKLNESEESKPIFNSIEELDAYYHCHSFEECINKGYSMFDINDTSDR